MHLPRTTENKDLLNEETKSNPEEPLVKERLQGKLVKKHPQSLMRILKKSNSLTSELEALKASLQSEREAAQDLRKAVSEAELRNSELAEKLENVTRKVDQLQESVQRLEDKSSISEQESPVISKTLIPEKQELLVKCISQNLGYAGGKPLAACVVYKCLLHWRSFELEETNIFNRIIQILSAIEVS